MQQKRLWAALAVALTVTACASAGAPAASPSSVPSASQQAIANAIDVSAAPFVGSRKSKKFYAQSCHTVKLIKAEDRIGFASKKAAIDAGFVADIYSTDCQ